MRSISFCATASRGARHSMNPPLRALSVFVAAALAAMTIVAQAQQNPSPVDKNAGRAFPTKPIRFVVPFSPGGGTDTLTRIIAHKMSESWGQAVVIENPTGAGGTIGTSIGVEATPCGPPPPSGPSAFAITAAGGNNPPY